jgi:hypothetical protein
MFLALHGTLPREVDKTSSSEDGAESARLPACLPEKLGELQQGLVRTPRIDTPGQTLDSFLLSHPSWNGESSLPEFDFDMQTAAEPMAPKDIQLLPKERMERIVHCDFARIAGIIRAGLKA